MYKIQDSRNIRLRLNGVIKEFGMRLTVSDLLKELNVEPRGVAVEVNTMIIKRQEYEGYELKDGDSIEIVNLVGGG